MKRVPKATLWPVAALLFAGLAGGCREPLPQEPGALEVRTSLDFGSVNLSSILTYVNLPDLTQPRHAEARIQAAQGGAIELQGVRLEIPAGALEQDVTITLDLPTDPVAAAHLVADLGPDGLQFLKPVTIRFDLTGADLTGVDAAGLRVAWWNGSAWVGLDSGTSPDGKALLGYTTHFTGFGAETPSGG